MIHGRVDNLVRTALRSTTFRVGLWGGLTGLAPDADHILFPPWAGDRPAHLALLIVAVCFAIYSCARCRGLLMGEVLDEENS